MQCLSGTGALRMGFTFVHDHMPGATVYVSEPTWGNHKKASRVSHNLCPDE